MKGTTMACRPNLYVGWPTSIDKMIWIYLSRKFVVKSCQLGPKGRHTGRFGDDNKTIANIFKAEQNLHLIAFQNLLYGEYMIYEPRSDKNFREEDAFVIVSPTARVEAPHAAPQ